MQDLADHTAQDSPLIHSRVLPLILLNSVMLSLNDIDRLVRLCHAV